MTLVLDIQHLQKSFGNKQVLKDLNLQVASGDFYGFIGPNGAGKSTTIRIILGLLNKTGGSAQVFGMEASPSNVDILKKVAYLPSEVNLYPDFTVKSLINMSATLHKDIHQDEIQRLARVFELDLHKKIKELSLGNRKKVGIVNMLMKDADLYILDEPTSGLDPLMQQVFWQEMMHKHDQGKTIFVSSHVLSEIQRYCNKAAFIKDGTILMIQDMKTQPLETIKEIRLDGVTQIDVLPGMSHLKEDAYGVSFHYQGELDALWSIIETYRPQITDVHIHNLDIETLFLHHYQSQEEGVV